MRAKLPFIHRLATSWPDLADALGISRADRSHFSQGQEARGVWEWLEDRDRLCHLPQALHDIGRDDLADMFDDPPLVAGDQPEIQDPAVLTTSMLTGDSGWHWESVYYEVLKGAGADAITVIDEKDSHRTVVEILFVVFEDSEIIGRLTDRARLLARLTRERDNRTLIVFVFVVGARCAEALPVIRYWLEGQTTHKFFLEPVTDPDSLRGELSTRIQKVIERNPHRRTLLDRGGIHRLSDFDDPSVGDL